VQGTFLLDRDLGEWDLLVKGVATYNGYDNTIEASKAERIAEALRPPLTCAQVHTAGF
jgi:hypothetical protein